MGQACCQHITPTLATSNLQLATSSYGGVCPSILHTATCILMNRNSLVLSPKRQDCRYGRCLIALPDQRLAAAAAFNTSLTPCCIEPPSQGDPPAPGVLTPSATLNFISAGCNNACYPKKKEFKLVPPWSGHVSIIASTSSHLPGFIKKTRLSIAFLLPYEPLVSVRGHGLLLAAELFEPHVMGVNIEEAGKVSAWNTDGILKPNILDTWPVPGPW